MVDAGGQEDEAGLMAREGEVLACVAYVDGRRVADVPLGDIETHVSDKRGLLWIGLFEPRPELVVDVAKRLGATDQAIDELCEGHRRPRLIDFGHELLVVATTVGTVDNRFVFGTTLFLIGKGFLLTVRRGPSSPFSGVRRRLEAAPELLSHGSGYVAAELLDLLVDGYFQTANDQEARIENLEQKLFIRGMTDADIRKLYRLRRDLLRFRISISPLADVCRKLSRVDTPEIDPIGRPYFTEVAERVQRVTELVDALREALAFAFEASLMLGQSQQNDVVRRLAAWAAILAVPTAIAGIYGMNFQNMPELSWRYGYPLVMSGMAAVCGALYVGFKRAKWL